MDVDFGGDLGLLAHEIGFFDRTFPFAVFSTVSSTSEVPNEAREFFQTTLLACRKLKPITSNQAEQISRDEELCIDLPSDPLAESRRAEPASEKCISRSQPQASPNKASGCGRLWVDTFSTTVPMNQPPPTISRFQVRRLCHRSLSRRSQNGRMRRLISVLCGT